MQKRDRCDAHSVAKCYLYYTTPSILSSSFVALLAQAFTCVLKYYHVLFFSRITLLWASATMFSLPTLLAAMPLAASARPRYITYGNSRLYHSEFGYIFFYLIIL